MVETLLAKVSEINLKGGPISVEQYVASIQRNSGYENGNSAYSDCDCIDCGDCDCDDCPI